jgi:hypothetical protein
MILHRVNIVPQRRKGFSELTGCDVLSIYGYRAVCSCGWRGSVRPEVRAARVDHRDHRVNLGLP